MKHLFFTLLLFTASFSFAQLPTSQDPSLLSRAGVEGTVSNRQDPQLRNGSGTLGNIYSSSGCGLNYVLVSQKVGTRFSPAGASTPLTLTVSGIPAGAVVQKSFLWYGGLSSGDDPDMVINTVPYTSTIIGTGPDMCWSYPGTINFRADVTPTVTGNGAYTIDVDEPDGQLNGMTLMVIYKDVFASYTGVLSINDGTMVCNGGSLSSSVPIPAPGCTSSLGRAFAVVADLQNPGFTYTFNGTAGTGTWNWWNTDQLTTTYLTGATTVPMTVTSAGDCFAWVVAGAYYQTTCTVPPPLTYTSSSVNGCAACSGSITVTPGGSAGPFSYSWMPSGTAGSTPSATALCTGSYSVTIADNLSCRTVTTSAIPISNGSIAANTVQTNVSCNAVCNGSSTVTPATGTAPYTYAWAPSGGTGATASGLCAGTYTCTVTDALGCSIAKTLTITQPPALTATTAQTNISCNGVCNGSATVTPSGGTSPYTYSWAPSGGTAATASSLCAGTYTCTITDVRSCVITRTFSITQPAALTATTSQTNVSCNASCNGAATVTASGGTSGYSYSWAPSGGTAATANSLCAGTYTCSITDANSCVITRTFSITQPPVLTATTSQTNVSCNAVCNGTATVTASGGTSGYTYSWAPSGGTAATANSLCAGTYTCTITDAGSCVITRTFAITQPSAITATTSQTNVSCNGVCNGTATITASGGTAGYTYAWAPSGGTTATANSLCAGSYTCTITDANSCVITRTFSITQPPALTATTSQTNVSCNAVCNGTATVTASGGTAGYTYAWAPSGGSAATANSLCAGTYTCTITDANSCVITRTFAITQPSAITATTSQTNVSCNALCNGTATVGTSGGTSPYTYAWAPSGGTAATAGSLCAGTYTCTITDAGNCVITRTFAITQPSAITATSSQTNVSCNAGCNGTAAVSTSGGTSPYTYAWAPSGGTAATAGSLCAGTYTCTITDANSCVVTRTFSITQPPVLTAATSQSNVSCNAGCNGTATVTASGGMAGYAYSWAPSGGTAATANSLCAGTYTCSITDANSCVITKTFTITQPPALTATTSQTNVSCNGVCNGTATVTASGGTAGYTYSWAPSGGSAATANSLCAGSYTCTITDANSCAITRTFTITQPPAITATTSQTNVSCNGACNGTATVTASGGTAGYTCAWTPSGGSAAIATSLCAGTYTCTITDANSCAITRTFTITQPPAIIATTSQTNVSCNGGCNGTATVAASGGTAGYTYSWAPSGGTAATANSLCAGTYTCTITDANSCVITKIFTITQPAALTATTTQTNVSCNAGCDGTATVTVSGGTAGYTYSWAPSGGTAATAGSLCSGTYTCTISDANGCSITSIVVITQSSSMLATTAQTNVTCNAACNGTAAVTVNGGTPGYTYAWLPSGGSASTAGSLCAGTYTCTVTDANGCQLVQSFTITQPPALSATATATAVSCNGACDGASTITASGGTSAYTYSWSPSGGTAASASGLCAGTYTCTVTDANGCTFPQLVTITQPTVLAAAAVQTNVSCNGACDGTAAVTASGGTAGYTYSWAPSGGTGATAASLCAGTYTCTITDANGCQLLQVVNITEPAMLSAVTAQTNVSCNSGCDGTATITVSGGTAGYTYSWTPSGGTGATANGLCAGTYTCSITDANSCSISVTVTIIQSSPLTVVASHTNVSCNAACNGTATVTVSGGTPGYAYAWAPAGGSAATAGSLCAGTYTCTITDANGCSQNEIFTITEPAVLSAASTQTNVSCNGVCDGTATTTASGGTVAYSYSWSPSGGSAAAATGLCPGTYTCTVTDANGCTAVSTSVITEPAALSATMVQVNVSCSGACNGTATISAGGGSFPYAYVWAPSGGAGATATGLCAGTYTCTVTDANGCTIVQSVTITEPLPLTASAAGTNVSCNAACDGAASVAASGGTAGYAYSWAPSGGTASTAASLCAGTYTCTVTDTNGCITTVPVTITEPSPLSATAVQANVSCNAACNGTATVTVSGGTPGYVYSWAPSGGAAATATGLCAGSYTCTITDANGCSVVQTIVITEPAALTASSIHSDALCNGSCNGTASVVAAGGTGGYSYLWAPGSATTASVSGLCAGMYVCTVTDTNACSISDTIIISEPAALTASIIPTTVTCFGGNDGSAASIVSGGTAPYTYLWSDGSTLSTTGGLSAGPVQLTVTDSNACSITVASAITQNPPLVITVNSDSVCTGGAAILTASGAVTYTWLADPTLSSTTGASVTATPVANTVYTVTGTDSNGCADTAYSTVTLFTSPVVTVSGNDTICPGTATLLTAAGAATYSWSPAAGLSAPAAAVTSASPSATTTYTLTGTSAQGCADTATYTVTVLSAPMVSVTGDSVCNGATATLTASGAATYSWTPSAGLSSASGATVNATVSTTTSYTVTGTDGSGCFSSATATVTVLPLPVLSVNSASVCAGSSVNLNATGAQTYAWLPATGLSSTGGATVAASPAASTTYTVTGTDLYGCVSTASSVVTLIQLPQVAITGDSVGCPGDAFTLTATATGTLSWSTGESSSSITITPSSSGYYTATATNSCGSQTDGIFVIVNTPPVASAGPDVTVGLGNSVQLNGSGGTSYSWFPSQWLSCSSCAAPVSTPETTTSYIVTVFDENGCSSSDTMVVTVNGEAQVFVPDIFSPDADGMNDNFIVRGSGIKSLDLRIYDRWGQVVFSGFGENSVSWDGTYKGSVLNNGVFVYTLDITYYDYPAEQKKGNLTLKK
ncbi:MAG: hypothetical protein JWO09_1526 [Bacteroidetes bacterium]|nr:hypothetical protein [Bacteroidota bacterium]